MGIYLNPTNSKYQELLNSKIVVDKSLLIEKTNNVLNTTSKNICFSRPRRFGKSTDANMLVAYYSKGCDSHNLFDHLKISQSKLYEEHINKHNVIHIDVQKFLSRTHDIGKMISLINTKIIKELSREYEEYCLDDDLSEVLNEIFAYTKLDNRNQVLF